MKLAYVDLCGFRGYRKQLRIEFADGFTIIDGQNGVGKSTIFDAIEFVLTGTIGKYGSATADGETVADYLWWSGDEPSPKERYVEVGFQAENETLHLRRTQLVEPDREMVANLTRQICDTTLAPPTPLEQLCASSIIRDEHIAALSLDLKETERYARLRDAIGATDADIWIERGSKLNSAVKRRIAAAQQEVDAANIELAASARRIDEARSSTVEDATLAAAVARLQAYADSSAAAEQLPGPVRARIAERIGQLEELKAIEGRLTSAHDDEAQLPMLNEAVARAEQAKADAEDALAKLPTPEPEIATSSDELSSQARDLTTLVALGRKLGLHDRACPLCASSQTESEFEKGLEAAERLARSLNEQAVSRAERARTRKEAEERLANARNEVDSCSAARDSVINRLDQFKRELESAGLRVDVTAEEIRQQELELSNNLQNARADLRIVETARLSAGLDRALRAESEVRLRLARAEEKLGRARRAEANAQALHRAAQRAAGETLDRRLDRVLPLMAELYQRLRPHPYWRDIEYSVRGDVRRFLKLQVGEGLNPQFIFSSGQRRATGLAFLLSINLSLVWSRWMTILLDDPVQHIDDFRSVHLAEVLAQICAGGRQVICAVEDPALADLLCRRLPIARPDAAKRVTLGRDSEGALGTIREALLGKLVGRGLITEAEQLAG